MPSADPVHPDDDTPTTPPGPPGRVLPFTRTRSSTAGDRPARSERAPQPRRPGQIDESPQQRLAVTAEAHFLARRQTLTDDRTADTYRATIDLVQVVLDGSSAQGLLDDAAHRHLTGMLRGLRDSPDAL